MLKFISILIISILFLSCNSNEKDNNDNIFKNYADGNIYTDEIFEEIALYQYNRDSKHLIEKIQTDYGDNPKYLARAIIAFGSIQDSLIVEILSEFLSHEKENVRIATAFCLGQTQCIESEKVLANAFLSEKENSVKNEILYALGKTGKNETLEFTANLFENNEKDELIIGKIQALSTLAERGFVNENIRDVVFKVIDNEGVSREVKYWCSYYLYRSKQNYENYSDELINSFSKLKLINSKSNILKACRGITKPEIYDFLESVIEKTKNDYRLRINAMKVIQSYDYFENEKIMFRMLNNSDLNIALTAANFFIAKGIEEKADIYFDTAMKMTDWKTRTKMLTAALKYSKHKEKISSAINSGFEASNNLYEKARLIEALSYDLNYFEYLQTTAFETEEPVIATSAISAISQMRYSDNFNESAKKNKNGNALNLEIEFAEVFKKAILSGDIAMMSIAASTIREEKFNYRKLYDNTYFVRQAMNKCILPRDIEAYQELAKTDKFLNGINPDFKMPETEFKTPDFEFIKCIPPNQKIKFNTSAGNFIIQMNVNETPVSVGTFIELAKSGFYNGKKIHRVVHDFVIQDGCPRGDGWGSPGFAIRSEFWPKKYAEGSVGLASAGKDTESSQWFITHSPTPHLNGRYTIIGNVIEGMDRIHKIQIGDSVISLEFL